MVLGLHQEKVTQTGLVTLGFLTILGRCMIRSDRTAVGFEPTFASLQEDNRGVVGPGSENEVEDRLVTIDVYPQAEILLAVDNR